MIKNALKRAVKAAGSEAALARGTGYSQPAIHKAISKGTVTAEMALRIEAFTERLGKKVDRRELCPKIFGKFLAMPAASSAEAAVA